MFEEQYRKMNQETAPSEALNDETFALMKEARDHRAAPPPKKLRRKPAIIFSAAGAVAAVLVAAVLLGFWLRNGQPVDELELVGNLGEIIEDAEPEAQEPSEENNAPAPETPEDVPEDEVKVETNQSTTSGTGDPREPDIINDETTVTFTSIREFLNALAKKEVAGYGKNYYNARDLIIVPAKLPDQARFRHFHLNTKTGKYSYSYLFTAAGTEYFLDVEVDADVPKTLRDLNVQKQLAAEEEIQTGKKGNQLFYLFGAEDYVTVTLTEVNSTVPLTEEQVATLLAQFEPERCSLTNALVDMTY